MANGEVFVPVNLRPGSPVQAAGENITFSPALPGGNTRFFSSQLCELKWNAGFEESVAKRAHLRRKRNSQQLLEWGGPKAVRNAFEGRTFPSVVVVVVVLVRPEAPAGVGV